MTNRRARAFQVDGGSRIELANGITLTAPGLSYKVAAEVCDVLNPSYSCKEVDPLAMTVATALGRIGSSLWEAPDWIALRQKGPKK